MISLMRVSGKETFSARSKAETTSKRVFRQDVERLSVCNASDNTCNNERKNKAHIAISTPSPPSSAGHHQPFAHARWVHNTELHPSPVFYKLLGISDSETHPTDVRRPGYFWPTSMFHKDQECFQQPAHLFRVFTAVFFCHFVVELQEWFL